MSALSRWYMKANAFAAGWKARFGSDPSVGAAVLALGVAQHETQCGDAWPGEYNWGAVQLRKLRTDERALAGTPAPERVYEARRALAAASIVEPAGALHVDSSPGKGWYWVYFCRFADDNAGADWFVHVLAEQSYATKAALSTGSADAVARAMYGRHYFEGVHVPTEMYHLPDGSVVPGSELNIRDYASAIARKSAAIRPALAGWTPGAPPPVDFDSALANADALVAKDLDDLIRERLDDPEYIPRGGNWTS